MSTWIFEGQFAVILFVALSPLALAPLVFLHYRRYGRLAGWQALVTAAMFLYVCGILAFTLFPLPEASDQFCDARSGLSYWQLVPFASVGDVLDQVRSTGVLATLTSGVFLQVAFNVILLVPLGVLAAYRYGAGLGRTVLIGLGVSLAIELTQGTAIWGIYDCPYRLADVDDLMTNTAGAALGWFVGRALLGRLPDPDPPRVDDTGPPTVGRRVLAGALDLIIYAVVGVIVQIPIVLGALAVGGADVLDQPWLDVTLLAVGNVAVGVALFLVVPLARRDRATLGQVATWLVETSRPTSGDRPRPASRSQVLVRFAVRWAPVLAASMVDLALPVLGLVVVAEAITVARSSDHRSLSGVASNTTTTTRPAADLPSRSSG